ncbi:MAG: serine hydroxymethyltransferase [Geminicoccaceae bacterium]
MSQVSASVSPRGNPAGHPFFRRRLTDDGYLAAAVAAELNRQQDGIELIASENITSPAVLEAQGSVLTNKYAEGYPGRRYYGGCEEVDKVEVLAIERAKALFGCAFANVQPHAGAQANMAVFLALLQPHDTLMGLSLAHGGHLTHGAKPNVSGKWFNAIQYGLREDDHRIDMDQVRDLAREHQPKLIIAGTTAYPRLLDFAAFRAIADEVGAYLMVDMAHISGLVAGGAHPSPLPHAHVVTSTTHKTLRGPRGGIVLTDDEAIAKKINSAVFPMGQGGPLMHAIAGKAVAFKEALQPDFRDYAHQIVDNAKALAGSLLEGGLDLVTGGTDNHLILVDLRPKSVTGKDADQALERAGITCNKNAIPADPQPPAITSGLRVGTPAGTTRGFGPAEFRAVGQLIVRVVDGLSAADSPADNRSVEEEVRTAVKELCTRFPIY